MTEQHKHAAVLRAIADGVSVDEFECRMHQADYWMPLGKFSGYIEIPDLYEIRRKQKTHVVNGFTVPEPLREAPLDGVWYFSESAFSKLFFASVVWRGCNSDKTALERGIAHATKEGAVANCKARLGIDPYKDES